MKIDLEHLPDRKRRDLSHAMKIIFTEFDDVLALATQGWKKQGRILKVILYGSYARGDWVDDNINGYKSDYDLLVVVSDERLADEIEYWGRAKDTLMREYAIFERLSAPANIVVHSLDDVNYQLSRGRPFFVDLLRDGIMLYELGATPFQTPKLLSSEELRAETQHHYDQWFNSASDFLDVAKLAIAAGKSNNAAFQLHQATEHFYHTVLLVQTLYSPRSHNLNFLRGRAEDIARDLIPIWPRDAKFTRRCFELLHQAYIKARYSPHYTIRDIELEWIVERVELLQAEVQALAEKRISNI
ncbi:HEPN domain-containing protein [Novosphingobium sp. RL4]|uniref:HEPN domain-containing protein n=1 Tax=Novosphingobium sp. RL4 TaxID=3109595 RepID=UPI002D77930B|nr:HEPN domain-containing protein [Novosphingobium sp. RL4]WRT94482.1 HEPN domain-containing protein [Novosphingobium sp. RL4]